MNRESHEEEPDSGIPELQEVLTRYVDSAHGYSQAAELMARPDLATSFSEIAARRSEVAREVAAQIQREGAVPEEEASVEGAFHRWWIRLRGSLADEKPNAVIAECLRGEKVLQAALEKALDSQGITMTHAAILRRAREEVAQAIELLRTALEE